MPTVTVKNAKTDFSGLVQRVLQGEFVTITRHGQPVAALVSVEAADLARQAMERQRTSLVSYLQSFPGEEFERNRTPSRDVEL